MATLEQINASKINGTDYVLMVDTSANDTPAYKPILCQTSVNIDRSRDVKDSSTKCGEDKRKGEETSSAKMEGTILNASLTDVVTIKQLHDYFSEDGNRKFKLAPNVGKGKVGMPVYEWTGFLSSVSDSYAYNEDAKISLTANAIGKVTVTTLTTAG